MRLADARGPWRDSVFGVGNDLIPRQPASAENDQPDRKLSTTP